jgi:DNA invertase Pin-like site-specific DNA recombinase
MKGRPRAITIEEIYKIVYELVKIGMPIYKAVKKAGIDRSTFYKRISKRKKQELKYINCSCKKFYGYKEDFNIHNLILLEDENNN